MFFLQNSCADICYRVEENKLQKSQALPAHNYTEYLTQIPKRLGISLL